MKRWDVINYLIQKYNYKTYLEIGVDRGTNFNQIKIYKKEGVDPKGNCKFRMSSDKFFHDAVGSKKYDIIFIDGLHHEDQCDNDIQNSLDHLNENGTIIVHDCNPPTIRHQHVPRLQTQWNGTVWKSFVKLNYRSDLLIWCVDTDEGCGIIRRGKQEARNFWLILEWEYFDRNRKGLLNLISVEEFKCLFSGE